MHVIATAGHVDHGKSTLVRALTGMEPDRWAEERRRGMTIDLGYAWCVLPGGTTVAFVDVPGHQRFVTNMLAGVGPVPAVLLVIAADDGWSRQTDEHVAALDALGVRHGVLAVTRSDLVDGRAAIDEAQDRLSSTSLAGIEAVAVSGRTGAGLDRLRVALESMTATLPAPRSTATRLWVDRVFTVRGAGTVVTGTLMSGAIAVGDDLIVSGSGARVSVRGLETLKRPVPSVAAVARVAVNLRGAKHTDVHRGDALVAPGRWAGVDVVDVRLVAPAGPIPTEPILHVGSAAVGVRVRPFDGDLARLTLDRPLPLHAGERAILRDPGRQEVVAGLVVLDTDPPSLRRRGAGARRADELRTMPDEPDASEAVARRGTVRRQQLIFAGMIDPTSEAPEKTVVAGDWLVSTVRWQHWLERLPVLVDEWAAQHPLTPAAPRAALAQQLEVPEAAIVSALAAAAGLVSDVGGVHRANAAPSLPAAIDDVITGLTDRLAHEPFAAPDADSLAAAGLTERQLSAAVRLGRLLRVAPGIYLRTDAVDEARRRLSTVTQPFTLSEARQALDTTRRVAVPLLELLDARGVTERVDSQHRRLRSG